MMIIKNFKFNSYLKVSYIRYIAFALMVGLDTSICFQNDLVK